jgi:hypothetical protein
MVKRRDKQEPKVAVPGAVGGYVHVSHLTLIPGGRNVEVG